MQLQGFKEWLDKHKKPTNHPLLMQALQQIRENTNTMHFNRMMSLPEFQDVAILYKQFCDEDNGPMKVFWNSYLDMISTLLCFIRATREGHWLLHLECIKNMLPWFFAYDHINYARYLPIYLHDMLALPKSHPEAHKMLSGGDFGVQRSSNHGFAQVPVDQTIEQTLNRSTKSKGGIVGFSLKKPAVQRWMLTAHARAGFVDKCRQMIAMSGNDQNMHKESGSKRLEKDEEAVIKVMETIRNWRNPFDSSEDLSSISSGCVASPSVRNDLLMAKEKGKAALKSFVDSRLTGRNKGYFDTLTKLKLGTFREQCKKTTVNKDGRNIAVKADRNLFARLLVIGQSRKIDLRDLLKHELGPIPWSLATTDGCIAKTNKAVLPKLLEEGVQALNVLPDNSSSYVIDAMALLQMLPRVPERFADLSKLVIATVIKQAGNASRIDFVADQYPDTSIKDLEHRKREKSGKLVIQISSPQQLCPRQWKKFMSIGSNKTNLIKFLVQDWSTNKSYIDELGDRHLFITHEDQCTKISVEEGTISAAPVPELYSNHEEADTRMLLHAQHASLAGYNKVFIKSSDTDVEVIACHHQPSISAEVIIISGTKSRSRTISIPKIYEKLGVEVCNTLPSLHALTGCDAVSTFVGKGKKKAFDMVRQNPEVRSRVGVLGEEIPSQDEHLTRVEKVVCALYGDNDSHSINETRFKLFCKKQHLQSHQLPPTNAALMKHLKRANFQAYIWKNALIPRITDQRPDGEGWRIVENRLEIDWTGLPPAPEGVMVSVCCNCKGTCENRRCSCVKNDLPCTDACFCPDECANGLPEFPDKENDEEDDDDGCDDNDENDEDSEEDED